MIGDPGVDLPAGVLVTDRLVLTPLEPGFAHLMLEGPSASDWAPGFPLEGDRTVAGLVLGGSPRVLPWVAYVVSTRTGRVIGTAGFHGRPVDGTAEIGYGIVAGHRRRGLGREAVGALVEAARAGGAQRLIAHVDLGNVASLRLLRGEGFVVGEATEEGSELLLSRDLRE